MPDPSMPSGEQPSMQGLLQQALKMQAQLTAAQDELAAAEVEGSAGGGLVTARMTGSGELVGLVIDPGAVDQEDTETLADLVLAAVRDASREARQLAAEKMGAVTAGLGAGRLGARRAGRPQRAGWARRTRSSRRAGHPGGPSFPARPPVRLGPCMKGPSRT